MSSSSSKINSAIKKLNNTDISSIKNIVAGIIDIINDPNAGVKDLKQLIKIDPPLSAKILKIANSAYFTPRSRISEIEEAILWIGYENVKEIALGQTVAKIFTHKKDSRISLAKLWKHSVATAVLSKMIYRMEFCEKGENIYAAGLLHELGMIVEIQLFEDDFDKAFQKSDNERIPLYMAETEIFGYTHAELGGEICRVWNLPDQISKPVAFHNNPSEIDASFLRLAGVIYISDHICKEMGFGYNDKPALDHERFNIMTAMLEIEPHALELITVEMQKKLNLMQQQGLM